MQHDALQRGETLRIGHHLLLDFLMEKNEDELSDQAIMPSSGYGDIQKKYSTLLNTSTE